MIIGLWHPGSGIGDQIFSYLAARATAERLGVDFGMVGTFKGEQFITLNQGKEVFFDYTIEKPSGKIVVQSDFKLFESNQYYNPEFHFIGDNTIIDGYILQDERYWNINKARQWLKTDIITPFDDLCIMNVRGGEYLTIPDLILPPSYWEQAIEIKKKQGIKHFEIHTDDPVYAKTLFPDFKVVQGLETNWQAVRYAKHLIISNSAFAIIPALLNENVEEIIAPRYWARRNIKQWSMPQNYYNKFTYV